MTYVIGVRRGDVTSIHTDSLLSVDDQPFTIEAIKNGVLFAGCIFGVAGDWEPAGRFIHTIRQAVRYLDAPVEKWAMFEQVCSAYNPGAAEFELLLSSRIGHERPTFFHYGSATRQLRVSSGDFYALGLGKGLYSQRLEHFAGQVLDRLAMIVVPNHLFAYPLSGVLRQTLVEDPETALKSCVGGFFTFVEQDPRDERRQCTSLFVDLHADVQARSVICRAHCISFDHHPIFGDVMLYGEKPKGLPLEWHGLFQNETGHDLPPIEVQTWLRAVTTKRELAFPYHFLKVQVVGMRQYAPFLDFARAGRYFADLNDYLDEDVATALLSAFEHSAEVWPEGDTNHWKMFNLPPTAGRVWKQNEPASEPID